MGVAIGIGNGWPIWMLRRFTSRRHWPEPNGAPSRPSSTWRAHYAVKDQGDRDLFDKLLTEVMDAHDPLPEARL